MSRRRRRVQRESHTCFYKLLKKYYNIYILCYVLLSPWRTLVIFSPLSASSAPHHSRELVHENLFVCEGHVLVRWFEVALGARILRCVRWPLLPTRVDVLWLPTRGSVVEFLDLLWWPPVWSLLLPCRYDYAKRWILSMSESDVWFDVSQRSNEFAFTKENHVIFDFRIYCFVGRSARPRAG